MRTLKLIGMIAMLFAAILFVSAGSAFADRGHGNRHDDHDRRGRIEHRGHDYKRHAYKRHYNYRDKRFTHKKRCYDRHYAYRGKRYAYGKPYWAGKPHRRYYWSKPYPKPRPKAHVDIWLR